MELWEGQPMVACLDTTVWAQSLEISGFTGSVLVVTQEAAVQVCLLGREEPSGVARHPRESCSVRCPLGLPWCSWSLS